MDSPAIFTDPLSAPAWRKWLALRVIAMCALCLPLAFWFIDLLDTAKLDLPRWLEILLVLPAVVAVIAFLGSLAFGITDLVVHLVPPGRSRSTLLRGDRSPEQIAKEFGEIAYLLALAPFITIVVLLALALFCALALGGVAAISAMWGVVSGWPSWAIVIAVLLLLLLLKK